MPCCAPKAGLARLAEDWRIILFAYLCALLPLAAIYALDFITKEWKSIRKTRRNGQLHVALSLPPLAVVVFYIHLQKLAEDYKEMATAITVAILCIFHVMRTAWGLVQLCAFKEWNARALQVYLRMGYECEPEVRFLAQQPSRDLNSLRSRVQTAFNVFSDILRNIPGLQKLRRLLANKCRIFCGSSLALSRAECERAVDIFMMVNSSLVDNEFSGADLPCRLSFAMLRSADPTKGFSLGDFLVCKMPEECAVRWTASFLSRFGSKWLTDTKELENLKVPSGISEDDILQKNDLPMRLAASIAFSVTHRAEIELDDGEKCSQEVSLLSPAHVMCSNLVEPFVSTVQVTEENWLPYKLRGRRKCTEVDFQEHSTSIRSSVSTWHGHSLNELDKENRSSVLNMTPIQVALFSKFIEEKEPCIPYTYMDDSLQAGTKLFIWQLGFHSYPFGLQDDEYGKVETDFARALLVPKQLLKPQLEKARQDDFCPVLQASAHVDNWLALEAEEFPFSYEEVQKEVSEAEVDQWGHVFSAQKRVESGRLQLEAAMASDVRNLRKMKFLGCLMDWVRSSLALWLYNSRHATENECSYPSSSLGNPPISDVLNGTGEDWNPRLDHRICTVPCSNQLSEALQEACCGADNKPVTETGTSVKKGLQTRLLWEVQLALMRSNISDPAGPESSALMMLCMLAYPSLRISKVENCFHSPCFASQVRPNNAESNNGDVHLEVHHSNSIRKCSEMSNSCYIIEIVEAPQPLHVMFQWNFASKSAFAQIGCDESESVTRFCWQNWKDGFMGRIFAQSEWRTTRLREVKDNVRTEPIFSKVTDGMSEFSLSSGKLILFQGWPPFRVELAIFERENSTGMFLFPKDLNGGLDSVFAVEEESVSCSNEIDEESGSSPEEIECGSGCEEHDLSLKAKEAWDDLFLKAKEAWELFERGRAEETECDSGFEEHDLFLKAKEAWELFESGRVEDALELLRVCIADCTPSQELEHLVSTVISDVQMHEEGVGQLVRGYNIFESMFEECDDHAWPKIIPNNIYERIFEEFYDQGCKIIPRNIIENIFKEFYDQGWPMIQSFIREIFVKVFGDMFEKTLDESALYCKGKALLLESIVHNSADERCIEAFESYLMLGDRNRWKSSVAHLSLTLCYLKKYCTARHKSDEETCLQHFMSLSDLYGEMALGVALLTEKGSLSRREYGRFKSLPDHFFLLLFGEIDMVGTIDKTSLCSRIMKYPSSKNVNVAFTMYSRIVGDIVELPRTALQRKALNRLALIWSRGADDFAVDVLKAEELYVKAIGNEKRPLEDYGPEQKDVHSINAKCNLAVLYSQRDDCPERVEKSVQLFLEAIDEVNGLENTENEIEVNSEPSHSSSMNNLAVLLESGKLVPKDMKKAKELYLRSVEIDENPIAMYNLAVLLKFNDPSLDNLEEAEKLFSAVADLEADLKSMPVLNRQLEKAWGLEESEISWNVSVAVDEIDDCLALVKVVNVDA